MALTTQRLSSAQLDVAAALLQAGECVAFPTETVYGLGANALDVNAVQRVFLAKGRPADNPLIVHIASREDVDLLASAWYHDAAVLMERFWPGPLTLVLPKTSRVPLCVTGGLTTVAVRMPSHPVAQELIQVAGLPLVGPSANRSGRPSPTCASHVFDDLAGRIAAIVDGGQCGFGVESTVVDCSEVPFRLLRPGGVTLEQLNVCVRVDAEEENLHGCYEAPRSPGMKYQHYAPDAQLVLVVGPHSAEAIKMMMAECGEPPCGVMAFSEHVSGFSGIPVLDMGPAGNPSILAHRLYGLLREIDERGLNTVYVQGLPETDLGMAIMNRLRKAAGNNVVYT